MSKPESFEQWEKYLNELNPNIIKLGLERVETVAKKLKLTKQEGVTVITVAGTNGKGSTSNMLASILNKAGYKTGLYTSPHILKFNERIIINGNMVEDDELVKAFNAVYEAIDEENQLTFFEFTTLAALYTFKNNNVNYIILEVGLGGRLDATNIIDADIVIIPSIGLDHCALLGDSIEKIAYEKAGVIKEKTKVCILGEMSEEASNTFKEKCKEFNITVYSAGEEIKYTEYSSTLFTLHNPVKIEDINVPKLPLINAPLSVTAAISLKTVFNAEINDNNIKEGIIDTNLHGRYEVISNNPRIILDVAHNPPASLYLSSVLRHNMVPIKYAVVGMLKDKDIDHTLLNLAFLFDRIYVTSLPGERGASCDVLYESLISIGYDEKNIIRFDNVEDAFEIAILELPKYAELVVFGSFLTVEAVMKLVSKDNYFQNYEE